VASLKEEISKGQSEIEDLNRGLSALSGRESRLNNELDELKNAQAVMVSRLESQIQNKEVMISNLQEKLSITFVDRILFEFGKAVINPEGIGVLAQVGDVLKKVKAKRIQVIGHTDDRPIAPNYRYRYPSNWELSAARAAAVVRYFQEESGLDPRDMEAVGRSFHDPVASNDTAEGRALNRRVNIIISPKAD
ncbi:MAG: OmpA family protein, partial [Desulfobacterales bacterium]|nr:OmpA family protein [Desulfobacterales bacterium]